MITTSREGRQGIDLVKDDVEHSLDKELQNIRNYQERMRENLDIAASQLDQNMRRQVPTKLLICPWAPARFNCKRTWTTRTWP